MERGDRSNNGEPGERSVDQKEQTVRQRHEVHRRFHSESRAEPDRNRTQEHKHAECTGWQGVGPVRELVPRMNLVDPPPLDLPVRALQQSGEHRPGIPDGPVDQDPRSAARCGTPHSLRPARVLCGEAERSAIMLLLVARHPTGGRPSPQGLVFISIVELTVCRIHGLCCILQILKGWFE